MAKIGSIASLEAFGRIRLSKNFFMRDFLYSEISNFYNIPNVPHNPELAVQAGQRLCEELLEPLQEVFGRISIRSAYRSPEVNQFGNEKQLGCANNQANAARHIWDMPDDQGYMGATACIVVNSYLDQYEQTGDFRPLAWWIHDHLPYSEMVFFPKLCAFNLNWHERPQRIIKSWIELNGGYLTKPGMENHSGNHRDEYRDLPQLPVPLTVDDYRRALEVIAPSLSEGQRAMLTAHYNAPHRTLTATQLAAAAAYSGYQAANLQYANVAKAVADHLNYAPPKRGTSELPFWTFTLADGYWQKSKQGASTWYWVLRPQVIAALQALHWT
nr:hypothetical protein [Nodosilinea sp. LEGE 07088]